MDCRTRNEGCLSAWASCCVATSSRRGDARFLSRRENRVGIPGLGGVCVWQVLLVGERSEEEEGGP